MAIHPALYDIADLLLLDLKEAGVFCSEVAWHVSDRPVTYPLIVAILEAHPRTDPSPKTVAEWIMASPLADEPEDDSDYVDIEFNPSKSKPSVIQRHDFRDAVAGFEKCPHGVPIIYRCRICRPVD
jgi:hypothetical protein